MITTVEVDRDGGFDDGPTSASRHTGAVLMPQSFIAKLRELESRLETTPLGEDFDRIFASRAALLRSSQMRTLKPTTEKA